MNLQAELISAIIKALQGIGIEADPSSVRLEYPENPEHGDYSTNVALVYAKKVGSKPADLAEKIGNELVKNIPPFLSEIETAGPGFINFKIKASVYVEKILKIANGDGTYGWSDVEKGKQVMVEYTDPNPFKIFHIGHLMQNAIGESISRLVQSSGSEVVRACYQGDVGLHVAKTIWGVQHQKLNLKDQKLDSVKEKVKLLGDAYVIGSTAYDENADAQKEIAIINKKIFEKSDVEINEIYSIGRTWSLEYFDTIYARLGSSFNNFFFESEVADDGVKMVKEFLGKGVFQESEGAIVFKGEEHGVHTRVFITSNGLPTYETKELGLNTKKFEMYPKLNESVIITANEQSDYFRVLLKVFSLINPKIAEKTKHISHGILRFASGKMSSRKGNIIAAETLIDDIKSLVKEKIAAREFTPSEADEVSDAIAIGAIKYTILRQSIGGDVIFDSASSISFEGDSGPYLQYATVRAQAVLEKARTLGIDKMKQDEVSSASTPWETGELERLISRFSEIVERARQEYAPQLIANYLITLAGAFNSFYASHIIVDNKDPLSVYRVTLTHAFVTTMINGLDLLGIKVPRKM